LVEISSARGFPDQLSRNTQTNQFTRFSSVGVTDAASHITYYAYDTESNLTSITDANSNQTAFTYDAFGRVTQTNFPSSLSEYDSYSGGLQVEPGPVLAGPGFFGPHGELVFGRI
jgi:YD repeat-containing protein